MAFERGQRVKIRCLLAPGAFPGEFLVTVPYAIGGILSGFVKSGFVSRGTEDWGYVFGEVISVDPATVTVQIPGSFFTTAMGRTSISREQANEQLQVAVA